MSMNNLPLVSIITVNYNNPHHTAELLESIKKLSYPNIEVIIVDNASAQNPFHVFKEVYPDVLFIRNDRNLGFAGGNNVGIRHAKGDYLFLVNNDTELTTNIIEGLLDVFTRFPDAGIVCPKFRYYYHKDIIEYAGYTKVNVFTGRNKMIGCGEVDKGQYDEIRETYYAHGGGMMISKDVINKIGYLPEIYFLYYEEFDWCEKLREAGYKIYYQYRSLIFHKESMTTGKNSVLKTYYINRNRLLFMRRNNRFPVFLFFMLYFVLFTIPKNTFHFLIKKQFAHLSAFWKAIYWNVFNPAS